MQTHSDFDFDFDLLKERAKKAMEDGCGEITAGAPGERPLGQWKYGRLLVTKRPDDEQGILRISTGGGISGEDLDYCVFRGDRTKCAILLEMAAKALREIP